MPVGGSEVGRLEVPNCEEGHHRESLVVIVGAQGGAATLAGGGEPREGCVDWLLDHQQPVL